MYSTAKALKHLNFLLMPLGLVILAFRVGARLSVYWLNTAAAGKQDKGNKLK